MRLMKSRANDRNSARWGVFLAFSLLCLLGGGGARADITSLLYVRPAAILCITAMLILPGHVDWRLVRAPLLMLLFLAGLMLVQLVPLPPSVWSSLPGHGRFTAAGVDVGATWRPISLSPDLTLNSLQALLVPSATLIGMAAIGRKRAYALLPILIAVIVLSAVLGIAQLTSGPGSALRFYRVTNEASAVGLFANRNHQAVFLVIAFPLLVLWILSARTGMARGVLGENNRVRQWLAVGAVLLLLPAILVTGSRGGIILGGLAMLLSWAIVRAQSRVHEGASRGSVLIGIAAGLVALAIVVAAVILARAESVNRLLGTGLEDERRLSNIPVVWEIVKTFFPWGTGFGTFDPVFRSFELDGNLRQTFFNHAHNDLLELLSTGGLPALILLLVFLGWLAAGIISLARTGERGAVKAYGAAGAVVIVILLVASLLDYPLRTPLLSATLGIAVGWLCMAVGDRTAEAPERRRLGIFAGER